MTRRILSRPLKYGVVLFPGFQALDVFGPLDIFNLHSKAEPLELSLLAATSEPVSTSLETWPFSQSLVPTHTFANAPADLEVLLVPGGVGTRDDANIAPAVEFVKNRFPKLRFLLTVCTGSALAAKAGVLDGKRATSNKRAWKWASTSDGAFVSFGADSNICQATAQGPNVDWVLKARWVKDGNIWTSSGISAGIDMTYAFVSDQYGEDVAQELADRAEYRRNTDPDDDPFAKFAGV